MMLVWWLNGWLEVDHHHVIEFEGPQASYKTGRCNFVIGEEKVCVEKKNLDLVWVPEIGSFSIFKSQCLKCNLANF